MALLVLQQDLNRDVAVRSRNDFLLLNLSDIPEDVGGDLLVELASPSNPWVGHLIISAYSIKRLVHPEIRCVRIFDKSGASPTHFLDPILQGDRIGQRVKLELFRDIIFVLRSAASA